MPRNTIHPNVNASLIREIRMIAQQFFRSRESASFWGGDHGKSAPAAPALKCCFCVNVVNEKPMDAFTVIDGYAVCPKHAPLVRGDRYTEYMEILRAIQH